MKQKKEVLQLIQKRIKEFNFRDIIPGKTRVSGGKIMFICPFHKEREPSFVVYPDGSWHCFGCRKHGNDIIDFVKHKIGVSRSKALIQFIKTISRDIKHELQRTKKDIS